MISLQDSFLLWGKGLLILLMLPFGGGVDYKHTVSLTAAARTSSSTF